MLHLSNMHLAILRGAPIELISFHIVFRFTKISLTGHLVCRRIETALYCHGKITTARGVFLTGLKWRASNNLFMFV